MQKNVPKSKDHSKSGRWIKKQGFKQYSGQHAADSIPVSKTKNTANGPAADVGWKKSDNSEFFYVKFVEWGTSKMPPRGFIKKTIAQCEPVYQGISNSELQKFANQKLGG